MPINRLNGPQVIVDYLISEKVPYAFSLCGHEIRDGRSQGCSPTSPRRRKQNLERPNLRPGHSAGDPPDYQAQARQYVRISVRLAYGFLIRVFRNLSLCESNCVEQSERGPLTIE